MAIWTESTHLPLNSGKMDFWGQKMKVGFLRSNCPFPYLRVCESKSRLLKVNFRDLPNLENGRFWVISQPFSSHPHIQPRSRFLQFQGNGTLRIDPAPQFGRNFKPQRSPARPKMLLVLYMRFWGHFATIF